MEEAGIPFTFHWGKVNNLNATKLRNMYGDKIDEWIDARNKLLSPEMLQTFTNEFMMGLDLDRINPPVA